MSYILVLPGPRPTIDKDPDASLIYGIDVADIIETSDPPTSVETVGVGVTVADAAVTGTVVHARISGGTAGATATVRFRWTTAGGDTDDRTIWLRIVER